MNKQLSPLEALNKIAYVYGYDENIKIVEEALKRLESVDRVGEMFCVNVDKKLKAFEIIKEKEVNVFIFLHSGDLETYNDMVEDNRKLTQEEYDLLKRYCCEQAPNER